MPSFRVAALASSVLLVACGEPECPVGTYKIRNICRKLDAGPEVASDEAGARVGDGGEQIDHEVDASTSPASADAGQQGPDDAARPRSDAGAVLDDGSIRLEDSGRACGAGFESKGDGCADIDECARSLDDCDDDPQACLNTSGGFSCACPIGFRGNGKGANGCVDIDECAERTHSCGSSATCNNTPGSYSCGACPAGHSPGAGGTCVDINECTNANGGCATSPMATCNNLTGMANTCTCPSGYTGNGVGASGCSDVDECMSNNGGCDTSPMASCGNRVGMSNTCACPTGYSGNGIGANGCADPCSPNPCGMGFTCTRSAQATAVCSATCAAAGGPGCQPGDKCATDADCRTGGDSTATCDATDKVCTRICPATTITDSMQLPDARHCREIDGTLALNPNFATISAADFPYLTRIRGDLQIGGNNVTRSVTLPALVTVDGGLVAANVLQLESISLPRLTTIGRSVAVQMLTAVRSLSMPRLRSLGGPFAVIGASSLVQLDLNDLPAGAAQMTFFLLCRLPSTQVSRFTMASFANVGCCTTGTTSAGCNGGCTCN